ncbi:beta-ketoacyl synthase N-terminal-like domain-containing protein [Flavobacterium lipolyticum]|uniref:Acyltransferase domain-containing protein n=1 Tax=Flavobacterium lipolyticum TaxID=2893754 RepID=A0ABS8M3X5_9FLAO|nr:type I polyketide synthase [Flavobacterium sp. F-126]MCC9019516.1 acyltransferase domain-containing protein [Flavobacterium sp. F-126]
MNNRSIKKDIAIIGMSGLFPKSKSIMDFWKNLVDGKELIQFHEDEDLEKAGVDRDLIRNPKYVKGSCLIEEPGSFDFSFFGYTKEEAALMDPQTRILHEQAWKSLEDAGYNPHNYSQKIGSFFSASDNINWRNYVSLSTTLNVNPFFIKHISNVNSVSRLISYSLNLKGPSYFVDTACSSSLVAVHIACRSLLMKECTMAIAGGVSIGSNTAVGYLYEEGSILSKDGHCKAFDQDSSGTVQGEGAGVVVLKRLADALTDRDHIYGVIRSTSVNNDGSLKVGYVAPSIIGQYECIDTALKIAEVDHKAISYIEAHGTGTKLGDAIEIEALNRAFNYDTSHQCSIGSLKTNFGHMDAAAGVSGLIKTALSLEKKMLPASLHFKTSNPDIKFKSGPFSVNDKLTEWESDKPRLAGVSSFGIGGTNAHAILEEPPLSQLASVPTVYQLFPFSAKTRSSLESYGHSLKDFLRENQKVNMADLAYTLKTGRYSHKFRNFIIGKDSKEAIAQLEELDFRQTFNDSKQKEIVLMFSGQGSQYYGMGKQLYLQYPDFKLIIDEGLRILNDETGVDYKGILGYHEESGSERDKINDTCYTQPLLFLLEYGFASFLLKLGVKPSQMIGHSLGEYVAACISEVFTFEEGIRLVVRRAQLMSEVERGAMLSVPLSAKEAIEMSPPDIAIAAINTENSCVISGSSASIKTVEDLLSAKGITFSRLRTYYAFHSAMMDPILEAYERELKKVNFSYPKYSFISCTTGEPIKKEEAVSPKYWVKHLRETVNFSKGLDFLLKEGNSIFIEIGSENTLLDFLRHNTNFYSGLVLASVLKHPTATKDDSYYLLKALGTLWRSGVPVNWDEYYSGQSRNKVSAPTYSFDKIVFPARVNPMQILINLYTSGSIDKLNNGEVISQVGRALESDKEASEMFLENLERPDIETLYAEAKTEIEKELAELWKSSFGYDKIGVNDDFFELGGDSLKAITLLKRVHKSFDIEITVGDFFENSSIRKLAREIDLALEVKELNKAENKSATSNQIRL